ncbi:hypothetical protein An07g04695 [Aspergillus niger]|uniref:Uncharacterized protein n=2 Tax=Aspergillus niger TaxID=5061 RepID=A2QN79_ASPNC|nr:hypothetical protein An07g04695 [Aspergillus niger]CAK39388.1 hypothetical protein An07g04695 [Aspergillus niger]
MVLISIMWESRRVIGFGLDNVSSYL